VGDPREEQRRRAIRRLPGIAALLSLAIGLTVLGGWGLGSELLIRMHPSLPAMMPITAVSLILTAGALSAQRTGPRWRRWGVLASAVATTLGIAVLTSAAAGTANEVSVPLYLRMSWRTAVSVALLGMSLLCMALPNRRVNAAGPWIALVALLTPLVSLTGYALVESRFYAASTGIGMALHTAVSLLLLSLGTLALHPERGPLGALTSSAAGGVMARRMLPTLLLPLGLGALAIRVTQAGVLDTRLTSSLFIVTMMAALVAIIGRNTLTLNRLHAEQAKAQQQAHAEAERQRALAVENARLLKTAEQAAREREEVLAIVSHDLKNPLSVVRVSTALVSKQLAAVPNAEVLRRQLGAIDRATAHMNNLIHHLLDAARLDAGQALAIERQPAVLETLVDETLELLEPQAAQKALRLERHLEAGLEVECDRERILQVLANLLGNAVKFTPKEGTVTIEARRTEEEVQVSVRDTGPGIPESAQEHLFERHWQAPGTARQGSGLGLYIARGIIEAHGGWIRVESAPGKGSTFTIGLPLRMGEPNSGDGAELNRQ